MDMLAGYGSESEEDRDLIDAAKQCVEQDLHQHQRGPPEVQQQQQQQPHQEQQARVQLPPADLLFDSVQPIIHPVRCVVRGTAKKARFLPHCECAAMSSTAQLNLPSRSQG